MIVADTRSASRARADYHLLAGSWRRSLLAENKSPHTIDAYLAAVRQLGDFLAAQGMPLAVTAIRREHIEAFVSHVLARCKPATGN